MVVVVNKGLLAEGLFAVVGVVRGFRTANERTTVIRAVKASCPWG